MSIRSWLAALGTVAMLVPMQTGGTSISYAPKSGPGGGRHVVLLAGEPEALGAVVGDVDRVPLLAQPARQQVGHPELVLHHEEPHEARLRSARVRPV